MYTNLTIERLKSSLDYDPITGAFTWLRKPCKSLPAGMQAGGMNDEGYHVIRVDGTLYKAHRLAWLYVFGEWPDECIDHINGDRADNRITNLRAVSQLVNMQNQSKAHSTSSTGLLGVSRLSGGRFQARIRHHGKLINLGCFGDAYAAHLKYVEAKRALHIGCAI